MRPTRKPIYDRKEKQVGRPAAAGFAVEPCRVIAEAVRLEGDCQAPHQIAQPFQQLPGRLVLPVNKRDVLDVVCWPGVIPCRQRSVERPPANPQLRPAAPAPAATANTFYA
jgi:hypothetical protein